MGWSGGSRGAICDDCGVAAGERLRSRDGTTEARHGVGGVGVGSMVIVTGLAAGPATAGAAVSDGGAWGLASGSGAGSAGGLAGCASRRTFLRLRSNWREACHKP